ncbi:MAG: hypothetical protein Q4D19_09285 [Lautropia sp.]|nr:hypothetical protein [Lautropia sp.]
MKHHHLVLVSALASALAACGGGGGESDTAATSSATSNASANTNVTVNASLTATSQDVADAAKNAAAAQQTLFEVQTRASMQQQALEEARQKSAEAAAKVATANAQELAAAQQAANEANAQVQALQEQVAATQQELQGAQGQVEQLVQQVAELEESLKPPPVNPADVAQIANGIPACEQNAAPVRDPETNLWLVCDSQIVIGNQTADVGTTKHASGRYYALPFPDHSMMFVGPKARYKYACGQHFCEWLMKGGSLDIEYAAAGKDGKFYRFTSCRTGVENKRICAMPRTGLPEGIDPKSDDREPEPFYVGQQIEDTDRSGNRGFRAGAATRTPVGCWSAVYRAKVVSWPNREWFRREGNSGSWVAVYYGGNCVGDVQVSTDNPDDPSYVRFYASADSWPYFDGDEVKGPDGKAMKFSMCRGLRGVFSAEEGRELSARLREDPTIAYSRCQYVRDRESNPANGSITPTESPVTQPTQPVTDNNTPTPTPAPVPEPAPSPAPTPSPAPAPEPTPVPVAPMPAPEPTPAETATPPAAEPTPTPAPAPATTEPAGVPTVPSTGSDDGSSADTVSAI